MCPKLLDHYGRLAAKCKPDAYTVRATAAMLLVKDLSSARNAVMHHKKGVEAFHLSLPREW
jgi:hypothetical protein